MMKQASYLLLMYTTSLLMVGFFLLVNIPLPWILGPLVAVFLLNWFIKQRLEQNKTILHISFFITGAQIGTTFTSSTIDKVLPYFLPFLIITVLLIFVCIKSGEWLAKAANMDKATGVLGSIPGGLSVMVPMSDSLKANTGLVAIFHTIRLMAVLFVVPLLASLLFIHTEGQVTLNENVIGMNGWTVLLYIMLFGVAYLLKNRIPAPYVLIPMLVIATLKLLSIQVSDVPVSVYHAAQLSIGIHLGLSITVADIKKAGKYAWIYLLFTCVIILLSTILGFFFAKVTELNFATAMLSLAPGGLVEMAITAGEVGADPAIVGSLQLIRLLFIMLVLPMLIRKISAKLNRQ
ncbi:AbrB family transcriptional regulator [Gracilibacillus sp. S3-1-1]|uniref:AbrB family transcriptional regulator n=1 Tax=Gracilibacillus pellucidus TaxID=3095368 RepID=A0ACC6M5F6_9BACI|nr:AbrB family transcriptional regulator [Gracilibacillus sp. S3-1-1]MDX8046184.1 AbrB family transcriptional regulator [Gracilibacillus sp. S3-1-1]